MTEIWGTDIKHHLKETKLMSGHGNSYLSQVRGHSEAAAVTLSEVFQSCS